MLTPEEEKYISDRAYIPEHILNLMVPISKGEPCLKNGYLFFLKDEWIIFIGYPLDHAFAAENLAKTLDDTIKRYRPGQVWLIAPEIPLSLKRFCQKRESDHYYKLELKGLEIKKNLIRTVKKASGELTIRKERIISEEHKELISEFIERETPNPIIRALFLSMEKYVNESETSVVLSAYNREESLSAFYVVELGAIDFATYVVGAHSKKIYVPGSSDILFFEMVKLAKEYGKGYIHLGLGVNEGIRRFKEKWGGTPFLKYEFCEYKRGGKALVMFRSIESKL